MDRSRGGPVSQPAQLKIAFIDREQSQLEQRGHGMKYEEMFMINEKRSKTAVVTGRLGFVPESPCHKGKLRYFMLLTESS